VDDRDVGMIQRREDFGFTLEPHQPPGVCRCASGRTLIATCRFRLLSVARYTSPMPPTSTWAVISYGPIRAPGAKATASGDLQEMAWRERIRSE